MIRQGKGSIDNMKIKIALLQITGTDSAEDNLIKGTEYCRRAKGIGADIILFPEMFSCGYYIPEDTEKLKRMAVPAEGEFVRNFQKLAGELNTAVGITFLEQHDPLPRNTIGLFDRHGRLQYRYSKVHTCAFGDERRLDAGDDFYVSELDTEQGIIKVGSMICFDREFPESARILMLKGAELILVPNACPMELNRLSQLRGRAYENMTAIATCNYPAGQPDCNGHSTLFDGVAFLPSFPWSRDMCILEAGEREDIYMAELDVDMLRSYREKEVQGNAYRHPEKYSLLADRRVEYPFIRKYRE